MIGSTTRLAFLLALVCLVLGVVATPVLRAPAPQNPQKRAVTIEERLSNAERIARGLPLNKPRRYFDSQSLLSLITQIIGIRKLMRQTSSLDDRLLRKPAMDRLVRSAQRTPLGSG